MNSNKNDQKEKATNIKENDSSKKISSQEDFLNQDLNNFAINSSDFDLSSWSKSISHVDDNLKNCLESICSVNERKVSISALLTGLPLENNKLTPELFVRAAARAGISSRIIKKELTLIEPLTLPAVLLLKGGKACLLVGIDKENNTFKVVMPESGDGSVEVGLEELQEIYAGSAIFAKPMYKYDNRSTGIQINKTKSWFWGTMAKFWHVYLQVGVAALLINLFAVVSSMFALNVYDRVVPNNAIDTLIVLTIGITTVYVFDLIMKMLKVYFIDTAGQNADVILGSRIFEQVMSIKMEEKPKSSGGFANELHEYESLRDFFSSATLATLVDIPFLGVFIFVMWIIAGKLITVPLIFVPIVLIFSYIAQKPLRFWVAKSFRQSGQRHALLVEAINATETIKAYGAESKMQRMWEAFISQASEIGRRTKFMSAMITNGASFLQQVAYASLVVYGVLLIGEGKLTMGGLIACSLLNSRVMAPLTQAVTLLLRFNKTLSALEALNTIMEKPCERNPDIEYLSMPRTRGEIEFRNVSFAYPDEQMLCVSDASFKINAGEKVAIVGKVGSGKSTIEKLILGLYTATDGKILVDGMDINQVDPTDLRKHIGYVPQDIYHFFGTARANIMLGDYDVGLEEINKALRISGVKDFTSIHPMGLDMPVGEGGRNLSGGQRQALAIARAVLRDPKIFMMDEPTAMMDQESENNFVFPINELLEKESKTAIFITHRAPILRIVDRIIVLDRGRVVANGPRDDVLAALSGKPVSGK